VFLSAFTDNFSAQNIEGCKQCSRAMPVVVAALTFRDTWPEFKNRLGPFQCLNLRFLVHTENYRIGWRVEIQTDNVFEFFFKMWIGAELKMFYLMGFESPFPKDRVYR